MAAGVPGVPFAMPLHRLALALPQLLTAATHTEDPPGMTAGKLMLQLLPEGESIDPGTEHVQL